MARASSTLSLVRFLFVAFVLLPLALVFARSASVRFELALDSEATGAPHVDLGVVRYPADAGAEPGGRPADEALHEWPRREAHEAYRLIYAHAVDAGTHLEARLDSVARRFRYTRISEDEIQWVVPSDCGRNPWGCVYRDVLSDSRASLAPLGARFAGRFESERWTRVEAAKWLLAFVQEIPYAVPEASPFGVLPPAIVASRDWGDCDSKSLLLMALLDRLGIGSLLLVSDAHAHALLVVDVRAGHAPFVERGREFAWAESTAPFPLGFRPPELESPDDWRVVLRTPSRP